MLCICQEYILCVCAWANALALQAEIMRSSVNLLFIFGLNLQNIHGNLFIQIKQRFDHLVVVIRGVFFHCHLHIQLYSGKRICTQPKNSKKKTDIMPFLSDMQMSNFNGHSCFGKKTTATTRTCCECMRLQVIAI